MTGFSRSMGPFRRVLGGRPTGSWAGNGFMSSRGMWKEGEKVWGKGAEKSAEMGRMWENGNKRDVENPVENVEKPLWRTGDNEVMSTKRRNRGCRIFQNYG